MAPSWVSGYTSQPQLQASSTETRLEECTSWSQDLAGTLRSTSPCSGRTSLAVKDGKPRWTLFTGGEKVRQVNAGDCCPAYHAHAALASALASCPGCVGLLRRPGLPSSPGPALPCCPGCVRAPQAPGSAHTALASAPSSCPGCAGLLRRPGLPSSPGPALPWRAHCLPSGTLSPFCLRVFDILQYNFSFQREGRSCRHSPVDFLFYPATWCRFLCRVLWNLGVLLLLLFNFMKDQCPCSSLHQQRGTVFPCTVNVYESVYRTHVSEVRTGTGALTPTPWLRHSRHSLPSQVTTSWVLCVSFLCFSRDFSPYQYKFWMNLLFASAFLNFHKYCHGLVCGYASVFTGAVFGCGHACVCGIACGVCGTRSCVLLVSGVCGSMLLQYFCRVHVRSCVSPGAHMQDSAFCMCLRRKQWAFLSALLCCSWDLF